MAKTVTKYGIVELQTKEFLKNEQGAPVYYESRQEAEEVFDGMEDQDLHTVAETKIPA